MIMPIQLLKLSAVNKEGSESVLIHCLFYIAMRSEEAAGGRLCRSISHKSILPNLHQLFQFWNFFSDFRHEKASFLRT